MHESIRNAPTHMSEHLILSYPNENIPRTHAPLRHRVLYEYLVLSTILRFMENLIVCDSSFFSS